MLRFIPVILVSMFIGTVLGYCLHDWGVFAAIPSVRGPAVADMAGAYPGGATGAGNESLDGAGRRRTLSEEAKPPFSIPEARTALEALNASVNSPEAVARFEELLRSWLEVDGRGAFSYVESLREGEMKVRGMARCAETLFSSDPRFLAQQALAMPGTRSGAEFVRGVARAWSQVDIPAALAWAKKLPEEVGREDALLLIRTKWATDDPAAAAPDIRQLPEGSSTASLMTIVATSWGATEPRKAVEWAATLPGSEKTLAMAGVMSVWARQDPAAAGSFAAGLPAGEQQNETVKSVISSWAGREPAQTAAWVLQFPAGDLRDQGIRQVVSAWNAADPEAVRNWAVNLTVGATRDAALKSYAETIAYWTPEKAAGIVGLINDREQRERSIETVLRSWSQVDPSSANTWFAKLAVSDDLKTRLQMTPPR